VRIHIHTHLPLISSQSFGWNPYQPTCFGRKTESKQGSKPKATQKVQIVPKTFTKVAAFAQQKMERSPYYQTYPMLFTQVKMFINVNEDT
jgi:hypothetical protein